MKSFKTLAILVCSSVIFFYACNDKTSTPKQETFTSVEVSDTATPTKQ